MELLNELTTVLRLVGAGIAGIGFYQFFMSLKDQNPNTKSQAFTELGVGLAIIGLAPKITVFITQYVPK